ncbi:MAG: phenylalanine--tRNA ligase subunit beta [Bacteroidales bacterium]|jgi:phenylalanyl-tRNA synthetase beta chain|nr:phenylalanine--tRNA ligase subunit beta [Bacteroidales bacterium]
MKISYNWIKDYLKIDHEPEKIADILTCTGLEVEGIEEWVSVKGGLEGVVIGKVLTCKKHPGADRLSVTTVDTGGLQPLQIVCGAPNVAAGQTVAVATVGAILYKGNESFEIRKSKIRGELSEGMICAEDELGLGTDHTGIMILNSDAEAGTPASRYFDITRDVVFEIGLTPNRIESGSHIGVARDIAAYLRQNENAGLQVTLPDLSSFKSDNSSNVIDIEIENSHDCLRYTGVTLSEIEICESPRWLKDKLKSIGLNPINNVVDITNFVQHETGQPLHAFDCNDIAGNRIIIKNLPAGNKFVTLDGIERNLSPKDLMICNENEGMCIAGVFGGLKSGIKPTTQNIFLESANFNPVAIRKTSKRHGIKTDSSFRFERGADPEIAVWALKRAAMLVKELAGGTISSEITDIYPVPVKRAIVEASYSSIARLAGKAIEKNTIRNILGFLEIDIMEEDGDRLALEIPARKVDVKNEADVIEEILRIYGYNNIETGTRLNSAITIVEKPDREKLVNTISDMLASAGFAEIMCNSLNPASWYEQNDEFDTKRLVILANPLSSDLNAMRPSLLYGGLSTIIWNLNRQNHDLKLFEFGHCYFIDKPGADIPSPENYSEKANLAMFITGQTGKQTWNHKAAPTSFFHLKSYMEMVFSRLGIDIDQLATAESPMKYFAESITWLHNGEQLGEAGRISAQYLAQFDIQQDVYFGNINWDCLMKIAARHTVSFRELPRYPTVRRDLALLLNRSVTFGQIRDLARRTERKLLHNVALFDVYEHHSLGADKKSYAVSFTLRDDRQTLTDKTIDKTMNSLMAAFERELGATVRK